MLQSVISLVKLQLISTLIKYVFPSTKEGYFFFFFLTISHIVGSTQHVLLSCCIPMQSPVWHELCDRLPVWPLSVKSSGVSWMRLAIRKAFYFFFYSIPFWFYDLHFIMLGVHISLFLVFVVKTTHTFQKIFFEFIWNIGLRLLHTYPHISGKLWIPCPKNCLSFAVNRLIWKH